MTPVFDTVHLYVDMQRIFARGGLWETPWMARVLPTIADLVARYPERTVFTMHRSSTSFRNWRAFRRRLSWSTS